MAFLLSNNSNSLLSRLRSTQHRQQEQLLEEDPALKRFKSYKKSVWRLKRMGDVLTIVVFAGCCYEIYVRTFLKKAAAEAAKGSGNQA